MRIDSGITSFASRSIQIGVVPRFGNARGSSSCTISSFSSLAALPLGRRPVSCSILSRRASSCVFTAPPGTALVSVHSFRIHWPPTFSTSGPCFSPRGSTQPEDSCCEAPHSTKRAASSRVSSSAIGGCSH